MNILAIGAHPDDIELGCGGLLLKAVREGHSIAMYVLTRGSASGDPDKRSKELMESSKYIGVNSLWIDNFEDTKLSVSSEIINRIEYFIHKTEANILISHSLSDIHHDHKAVASCVLEAGRLVPNIIAYEIPLTRDFKPQIFYDISDVIDDKVHLIKFFKSQREKIYLKANAIKGLAEYRALQSRLNTAIYDTPIEENVRTSYNRPMRYVEAFEVLKICIDKEFKLSNIRGDYYLNGKSVADNNNEVLEFYKNSQNR